MSIKPGWQCSSWPKTTKGDMTMKPKHFFLILAVVMGLGQAAPARPERPLTCAQFLQEALPRDPDFQAALQTYLQATYRTLGAQALADWTLKARAGLVHNESDTPSAFQPASVDAATYQLSLEKLFLSSGTRLTLSHQNEISRLTYPEGIPAVVDFGFGPVELVDQSPDISTPSFTLSLVQPLLKNAFGLARRFPLEQARLQEQGAVLDAAEAWENRIAGLAQQYLDWLAAYENRQALQEIVEELIRLEKLVTEKVKAGVAEKTDLLRTRDNLLQYQAQLLRAENNLAIAKRAILYLMTGAMPGPEDAQDLVPAPQNAVPDGISTARPVREQDLDSLRLLQKLDLLKGQLQDQLEVADNSLLPSLDLAGSWNLKGRDNNDGGGYSRLGDFKDYSLMLQASYPLGASQGQGDVGAAQAGLKEVEANRMSTRRSLGLNLKQLWDTIENTKKVVALEEKQLQNGKEKLAFDTRNYRIGRLDTFYLIDSQNALTNARLQLVNTQIQLKKLQVQYLALADKLLPLFPQVEAQLHAEVR